MAAHYMDPARVVRRLWRYVFYERTRDVAGAAEHSARRTEILAHFLARSRAASMSPVGGASRLVRLFSANLPPVLVDGSD